MREVLIRNCFALYIVYIRKLLCIEHMNTYFRFFRGREGVVVRCFYCIILSLHHDVGCNWDSVQIQGRNYVSSICTLNFNPCVLEQHIYLYITSMSCTTEFSLSLGSKHITSTRTCYLLVQYWTWCQLNCRTSLWILLESGKGKIFHLNIIMGDTYLNKMVLRIQYMTTLRQGFCLLTEWDTCIYLCHKSVILTLNFCKQDLWSYENYSWKEQLFWGEGGWWWLCQCSRQHGLELVWLHNVTCVQT